MQQSSLQVMKGWMRASPAVNDRGRPRQAKFLRLKKAVLVF